STEPSCPPKYLVELTLRVAVASGRERHAQLALNLVDRDVLAFQPPGRHRAQRTRSDQFPHSFGAPPQKDCGHVQAYGAREKGIAHCGSSGEISLGRYGLNATGNHVSR